MVGGQKAVNRSHLQTPKLNGWPGPVWPDSPRSLAVCRYGREVEIALRDTKQMEGQTKGEAVC